MAQFSPAKKDVLEALANDILHNYGRGRAVVAIDGIDDTRFFADELSAAVTARGHAVFRASMDRFYRPQAERNARGQGTAAEFYANAFDYSTFRRILVEPFRLGGSTAFVTAAFDLERDMTIAAKWLTAPKDALLIVDGMFLNRSELRGLWNFSVWLEPILNEQSKQPDVAEPSTTSASVAAFRSAHPESLALYIDESSPRTTATAIMSVEDRDHPRRVFADAC